MINEGIAPFDKNLWTGCERTLTLIFFALLSSLAAHAQIPFYTDDADTTSKGEFHLEVFNENDLLQRSLYPAKRQNLLNFTLNYGVTEKLELGINAPVITILRSKVSELGNTSGLGDAQFGLKYRFHDAREGSTLPAMTVVFLVEAPTGSTSRQTGSGLTDYWLYGVAQKSLTEKSTARFNAGILLTGNSSTGILGFRTTKSQVFTGNGSLTKDFTEKLRFSRLKI